MRTIDRRCRRRSGRVDVAALVAGLLVFVCFGLGTFFVMRTRAQETRTAISRAIAIPADGPAVRVEATSVSMPQQFSAPRNLPANQSADNLSTTPELRASANQVANVIGSNRTATIYRPVTETEMVPSEDDPSIFVPRQTTRYLRTEVTTSGSSALANNQVGSLRPTLSTRVSSTIDREANPIVNKIRRIPADERTEEDLAPLKELVTKQFEKQHQTQVDRLKRILEQASATQQILEQRNEKKDEIVQRRVLELLGENDPLNWNFQVPNSLPPNASRPTALNSTNSGFLAPNSSPVLQTQPMLNPPRLNNQNQGQINRANPNQNLNQNRLAPQNPSAQPQLGSGQQNANQRPRLATEAFREWIGNGLPPRTQSQQSSRSIAQGQPSQNQLPQGLSQGQGQSQATQSVARSAQAQGQGRISSRTLNAPDQRANSQSLQPIRQMSGQSTTTLGSTAPQMQAINLPPRTNSITPDISGDTLVSIAHRCRRELQKMKHSERLAKRGFIPDSELTTMKNKIEELRDIWAFQKEDLEQELRVAEIELKSALDKFKTVSRAHDTGAVPVSELMESEVERSKAEAKYSVAKNKMNWIKKYESDSSYGLVEQEETDEELTTADSDLRQDEAFEDETSSDSTDDSTTDFDTSDTADEIPGFADNQLDSASDESDADTAGDLNEDIASDDSSDESSDAEDLGGR